LEWVRLADAALLTLLFVLNIGLPVLVVRRDIKRLRAEQLERAWTDVTVLAACLLCGPLCLPIHFVKTRRSIAGFAVGLLWTVGLLAAVAGLESALSEVLTMLGSGSGLGDRP
jgi:hypothetical protein